MVYETPEASGNSARDDSLKILRQWMSARCDAFVAVGGLWWQQVAGRTGIPIEAGLAIERGDSHPSSLADWAALLASMCEPILN
jgi:hypothetical protein